MTKIIFIDGIFYEEKDAKVSVLDHGYLYGNGCWTTLMTHDHKLFMLDEHIERLYESAKIIQLDTPWEKKIVRNWVIETYKKNAHIPGRKRIRVGFHRGVGPDIFVDSGMSCKPSINIIVSNYPEEKENIAVKNGLDVMTINLERVFPESKNNNFLPSYFASFKAKEKNKDDALFRDRFGHVTEATTGNIFFFKDSSLFTTSSKILKGVTRKVIIHFAKKKGIRVIEKMFNLGELLDADEVFISGTTKLIVPVIKIDDKKISKSKPGSLTLNLREELIEYLFTKENEFTEKIFIQKNK
jgi:branched-chain amino acid aminotransferase|tara:strand:+ start:23 stop:916 length:894 start_codon:yes stop_codon:yes gene_type:complete